MNITIVGLGLIGGSVAKRIKGFHDAVVTGMDINEEVLVRAENDGVISRGVTDGKEAVENADLVILCTYPRFNIDFVRDYSKYMKNGAVITDVSGVKGYVVDSINKILPDGVDFVGGHPMAGRETGGYENSLDTLFDSASYLITPTEGCRKENVELIKELAEHIGCTNITVTTPEEHDAVIAYTSQLMHVVAVALCDSPMIEKSKYFSAGSLRDCTRVALINEKLWSELFLENKDELSDRISELEASLEKIKSALNSGDRDKLEEIMKHAKNQKIKWLTKNS